MGIFDILRKKEVIEQPPIMTPMPILQRADVIDPKTIEYMTQNAKIPSSVQDRNWGHNVEHMSFTNLKNDADRFRLKRGYESEIMMRENFSPRFRTFKPGMNERIEDRLHSYVVDMTLSKAIGGDFQKTVTSATNVIETKTQSGPIQEKKKSGGILGMFG